MNTARSTSGAGLANISACQGSDSMTVAKRKDFGLSIRLLPTRFADASANFMNQRSTGMADKQYIERGAAKDAIFEYICGHTMSKFPSKELLKASKMGAEGALNEIDYVPAADVVEVVHAEWQERCVDGYWHYGCPVCGYGYATEWRDVTLPNYCSNCGAKMRINNEQKK